MKLMVMGSPSRIVSRVIERALLDPVFSLVVTPSYPALPPHPKLFHLAVDSPKAISESPYWRDIDTVICAIVTSVSTSDDLISVDNFFLANDVQRSGARSFVGVCECDGSHPLQERFEKQAREVGFDSLTIIRPFVAPDGAEEKNATFLTRAFGRLIDLVLPNPRTSNQSDQVASVSLHCAKLSLPGIRVVEPEEISKLSRLGFART